jgi:hypothetical protein
VNRLINTRDKKMFFFITLNLTLIFIIYSARPEM